MCTGEWSARFWPRPTELWHTGDGTRETVATWEWVAIWDAVKPFIPRDLGS